MLPMCLKHFPRSSVYVAWPADRAALSAAVGTPGDIAPVKILE